MRKSSQTPPGFHEFEYPLTSIPLGEEIQPILLENAFTDIRGLEDLVLERVVIQQEHTRDTLRATLNINIPDPSNN